ncbi:MAG: hypothetical protein ABIJ81_02925 [Patescibacteria group bacterium]
MASKNQAPIILFNQPIRFYIDTLELPWVVFSLFLFTLFVVTFWLDIPYLELIVPITLVSEVLTVAIAVYFYAVKKEMILSTSLALGATLGFFLGLISAILALVRFWHIWLVFNLITESVMSALLGLIIALLVKMAFRLPWFNKSKSQLNSEI